MIARLKNEQGITLLETLATTIILAFALISIYMGILYAEKQVQRNYHDRVANLLASGELDWQLYYKKNYKMFNLTPGRQVQIDRLGNGRPLYGVISSRLDETFENPLGLVVPFSVIEVTVKWLEPGDNTSRSVVVREDYY